MKEELFKELESMNDEGKTITKKRKKIKKEKK